MHNVLLKCLLVHRKIIQIHDIIMLWTIYDIYYYKIIIIDISWYFILDEKDLTERTVGNFSTTNSDTIFVLLILEIFKLFSSNLCHALIV